MATKLIYKIWYTKVLSEFLLAVSDTDIKGHKTHMSCPLHTYSHCIQHPSTLTLTLNSKHNQSK